MPTIFDGVDKLIGRSLGVMGIGEPPHHRHTTSALRLSSKPSSFDGKLLVSSILARMERNWQVQRDRGVGRLGSDQNWRWEKKPHISPQNPSIETHIEKAIANECDESWVNQVPTASGLMTSTNERHCDIDLAHRVSEGEFEFIELKYGSDTPVFAAFEILKCGLLYLFSRKHAAELGYEPKKEFLKAK